jgi:signal transduction histidine kinase
VLLAVWVLNSLAILVWLFNRSVSPVFLRCLHTGDILWPLLITAFSGGPSGPLIPLYSFVLISAVLRYGIYRVGKLRARATAVERAKIARELHDGAIQSLISAEMSTDILRRRAEQEYPPIAPEIELLQSLLRGQVLELRELMHRLKPMEIEPDQLLVRLAEQVDRFRRDSGIAARFVSDAGEIQLSANTCGEILLIVQEALVNIRKHAQAADVLVTFGRRDEYWCLSVSDDGVGFGFEGTLADTELMKSTKGPAIIKERVTNLGGELFLESKSPHGSQLLIRLPQKGFFSHGR